MQIGFRDIAKFSSGIYVNVSSSKGKDVYYLQVRHWDKERKWVNGCEPEISAEARFSKNYLQPGDLLLATKGSDPFAVLYDGRYQPAIASSVFTVIKVANPTTTIPAYLQWYLNHPSTTQALTAASRGTSMPLITRDVIEELMIPVPPVERQTKILRLQQLQQHAMHLRRRINELKESLFQYQLLQIANGE